MSASNRLQAIRGFTLVEVLVAMTIAAALTSTAFIAYRYPLARAQHADAQAGLLQAAAELEHCHARHAHYQSCTISHRSPNGLFTISVSTSDQTGGFILSATSSLSGPCGDSMTLDALGERLPDECW